MPVILGDWSKVVSFRTHSKILFLFQTLFFCVLLAVLKLTLYCAWPQTQEICQPLPYAGTKGVRYNACQSIFDVTTSVPSWISDPPTLGAQLWKRKAHSLWRRHFYAVLQCEGIRITQTASQTVHCYLPPSSSPAAPPPGEGLLTSLTAQSDLTLKLLLLSLLSAGKLEDFAR